MLTREAACRRELAKVSAYAGERIDLIQSGGGNTSVKASDGRMYIKASGYQLRDVAQGKGIASINYRPFGGGNSRAAQDQSVEDLIQWDYRTIASGGGFRPSLEVSMHALLGAVVLHTHPVVPMSFLCIKQSKKLIDDLFRGEIEFLYIPYAKPGIDTGVLLLKAFKDCRVEPAARPSVIFLENHGIVVHGETAEEVIAIHESVLTTCVNYFPYKLNIQSFQLVAVEDTLSADVINTIKAFVPELSAFVGLETGNEDGTDRGNIMPPRSNGMLFPDAAVYCGGHIIELDNASAAPGTMIMSCIEEYRKEWKQPPHIWKLGSLYICAGTTNSNAASIAEVWWANNTVNFLANRLGKPRYLPSHRVRELLNWEAELYRKTLSAGE